MTEIVVDPSTPDEPEPSPAAKPEVPLLARVLGVTGRALMFAGVVVFLFAAFQLWGTNLQEARAQDDLRTELSDRFQTISTAFDPALLTAPVVDPPDDDGGAATGDTDADSAQPTTSVPVAVPTTTVPEVNDELLALLFPEDGDALAQIQIPSIEVDKVVVNGVAVADLRKGPGHYSQTALPGNAGNASIAGHRTTYGAPFNRIDELQPGDEITVTSIQGEFTYRVLDPNLAYVDNLDQVEAVGAGHIIVRPSATWVLGDFGDDRLTLTACHPKLSSRQRIIVAAELVDDAVAIPEWAIQAEASRRIERAEAPPEPGDLGADETNGSDDPVVGTEATAPDHDTPTTTSISDLDSETAAPDLDEGLSGERDAIAPAAAWMLAAIGFWYAGGWAGRRVDATWRGRLGLRLVGLLPAAICLWFSFELIDRALPAG